MTACGNLGSCCVLLTTLCLIYLCQISDGQTLSVPIPGPNCNDGTNQTLLMDGAHVYSSRNDTASSCDVNVRGYKDKTLIVYNYVSLVCGQTIKIYDSGNDKRSLVNTFDCETRSRDLETEYISSKYVTIVFDNPRGQEGFNFSITVTSYDTSYHDCDTTETSCSAHDVGEATCIDKELYCDNIKNCPDGRDETNCPQNQTVLQQVIGGIIAIGILVAIGVGVWYCCTRRQTPVMGRGMRGVPMGGVSQTVVVQAPPAAAPPPAYPTGVAPPPVGYQAQPVGPPPGLYQHPPAGSYPSQGQAAAPPPSGYQPVPTAPPSTNPGYPPPAAYAPAYPPPPQ